MTITATDVLTSIASIEYRVNQADAWQTETYDGDELSRQLTVPFAEPGFQYLEYRTTDSAGNVSDVGTLSFSAATPCTYARSDEFDGPLDGRWLRHTRNGGTPTTGEFAPTVADGKLSIPTHEQELDGGAVGPVNFLGQDLAALGDAWTFETQFTVKHNGGWQHVGLMVWNGDNNLFRSTITHNQGTGAIYVEQSKDNPTSTEGARVQAGGNVNLLTASAPVTIKMRYSRTAGANTVVAQYQVVSPANIANPDWVNFPASGSYTNDLNPAGGARRDAAGSRIGIISAGNFPGGGTFPGDTPADVKVDYVRITPDTEAGCPEEDVVAPATTAALDPAQPGPGGTYDRDVTVDFTAADDDGEFASGVDFTEFSVDGGVWQQGDSVDVTEDGEHTVRYRSTDNDGNLEVAKSVVFTVDKPNVVVKDIYAGGTTWTPDSTTVPYGETVTWHWEEGSGQPHNVGLIAPDADRQQPNGGWVLISDPVEPPGSDPTSYTFRKEGTWEFVCQLHSSFDQATREWTGMVGTVDVEANTEPDTDAPGTTAALNPAQPGPGGTYTGDVTVSLTAEDADGAFPSGVARTEYRVDGGNWVTAQNTANAASFLTSFKVTAEGAHLVEYRSTDGEGNVEETQSVAFKIDKAGQSGNPPGGNPPGGNPPGGNPPGGNPPAAVAAQLNRLPKTSLSKFRKRGLTITSACEAGLSGKVQVALSRKQAKRIGLKKAHGARLQAGHVQGERPRVAQAQAVEEAGQEAQEGHEVADRDGEDHDGLRVGEDLRLGEAHAEEVGAGDGAAVPGGRPSGRPPAVRGAVLDVALGLTPGPSAQSRTHGVVNGALASPRGTNVALKTDARGPHTAPPGRCRRSRAASAPAGAASCPSGAAAAPPRAASSSSRPSPGRRGSRAAGR